MAVWCCCCRNLCCPCADCLRSSWYVVGTAIGGLAGLPVAWPWRGVSRGVAALMAAARPLGAGALGARLGSDLG
eukprot:1692411-Pyramimonas_sp.AAC.1